MARSKDEHIADMLRIWHDWYGFVAKAVHENRLRLPDTIAVSAIDKLRSIPTPMEAASWCADVADALTETQYSRSVTFLSKLQGEE